jgi:hypothetical protein
MHHISPVLVEERTDWRNAWFVSHERRIAAFDVLAFSWSTVAPLPYFSAIPFLGFPGAHLCHNTHLSTAFGGSRSI